MEPNQNISLRTTATKTYPEDVKVIEWEDFEHDLARLSSLSSALNEAKEKKRVLQQKLDDLTQVNAESLGRMNELEEMCQKLESTKTMMENMSIHSRMAAEDASKQEEQLSGAVQSLLVAGGALSVASRNLQFFDKVAASYFTAVVVVRKLMMLLLYESSRVLSEEKGYVCLRNAQKMLRIRQQHMTSQISMLYPVKISVGPAQEQELERYPSGSVAGTSAGLKPVNQGSLTIQGLHLTMLSFRKMSFFSDKKKFRGGSHSYIIDNAPSIELTSSESSSNVMSSTNAEHVEFPPFFRRSRHNKSSLCCILAK